MYGIYNILTAEVFDIGRYLLRDFWLQWYKNRELGLYNIQTKQIYPFQRGMDGLS